MVGKDQRDLVLVQDPSTNSVYKAFRDDITKLGEICPDLGVAVNWKDKWKDCKYTPGYKDYRQAVPIKTPPPPPPPDDMSGPPTGVWRDRALATEALVEEIAEPPSLDFYLEEQPDLKFVPINEFE